MSKVILCVVDFTSSSRDTIKCAALIARDLQAHLIVLYTYRLLRSPGEEVFQQKKKIEQDAILNFASIETEILSQAGITYDFKTEVGFLSDRIEAYSKKVNVVFVVIDKSMSTENHETFEDLIDNIQIPIVLAPSLKLVSQHDSLSQER